MKDAGAQVASGAKLEATLAKGIRVLEALNASRAPLGISSLSNALGLGKSNVHRMLITLSHLGFVRQEEETKRYYPTLRTWELGSQVVERNLIRRGARSVMKELVERTGDSTYLTVLRDTEILYLEKVEGKDGAHSSTRPGVRIPAILPASGKLLLALQPNWEAIVERAVAQYSGGAGIDLDSLKGELQIIRNQRFAISKSATQKGLNSLAVPLGSDNRPPVAALGFAILENRWEQGRVGQYLALLRQAAERISAMPEILSDRA